MNRCGQAHQLLSQLQRWQNEMIGLLTALAELESPSHVPQSQQPILTLLGRALHEQGFKVRHLPGRASGGQLLAVPPWRRKGQPWQILLGHCDTVWPLGTLLTMPVEQRGNRLHGPGVYDMKAGLVQAIFATKAIQTLGIEPQVAPVFFVNSDEEIGSHESADPIRRLARRADRAFVMEPSLEPGGKLKTARKGVGKFTVRVFGRAAHAGLSPQDGASAILELAHVVHRLFALNDHERGITVNVGTIDGGLRPNVIAPESKAEVDVRVATVADARAIEQAIHALQPSTPGTRLEITGSVARPPMEPTPGNQRLWNLAQQAAQELGIEIEQGTAGGGSDGNFTSQLTPTLDGLGAVGDGAHAVTEFADTTQMPFRSALLARLILEPPLRYHVPNLAHTDAPPTGAAL